MSFLAWAFALGGLAVVLPILFHLIRPTPKGSQSFGSLMFLRESPPRISKRSRIDNWLLLLMRAAIVLLLAAAFMRPFFRTGGEIFVNNLPGNRVAVLIDKSASMKRGDLWKQVRTELDEVLGKLEPGDDVALYAFDRQVQTLVGFSDDKVIDLESRKQVIRNQFAALETSWYATDMGSALASTADFVSELEESDRSETGLQVVLISDMQTGADLGGLQAYVWPEDVRVDIRTLDAGVPSNATARVLPEETTTAIDLGRRVRLVNSEESDSESFSVSWQNATGKLDEESKVNFYVPPGTSRVLRVPTSKVLTADRLVVQGDQCNFDNEFYVTSKSARQISIAYFGTDKSDDAKGCLYFLQRVIPESRTRVVKVEKYSPEELAGWNDGVLPRLVVVTEAVSADVAKQLDDYVKRGGLLFAVITDAETLDSLGSLTGKVSPTEPPSLGDEYAMFAQIDFTHPLFQPLSGPRFNDFTNIRFWKHLPLSFDDEFASAPSDSADSSTDELPGTHIIAGFDDGTVAIWQNRIEKGIVVGMASSWRPDDSQLALSTKFVPLITSLLGMTEQSESSTDSYIVGQSIQLPSGESPWSVTRPDNQVVELTGQPGTQSLFDMPGVFDFTSGDQQFQVAVNIDPNESRTNTMDSASLESFDVRIGTQPSREELAGGLQKLKDKQLENRQRLWKWFLLAAICLLILETLLAGKRQTNPVLSEAAA